MGLFAIDSIIVKDLAVVAQTKTTDRKRWKRTNGKAAKKPERERDWNEQKREKMTISKMSVLSCAITFDFGLPYIFHVKNIRTIAKFVFIRTQTNQPTLLKPIRWYNIVVSLVCGMKLKIDKQSRSYGEYVNEIYGLSKIRIEFLCDIFIPGYRTD